MAERRESTADQETISACRERGAGEVTARQLERWRQAGCLPARERHHELGVRGSHAANPPGYLDQVMAMAALVRTGVSLREAPIALFADGFPVDVEVLKNSYCHFLVGLRDGLVKLATKRAPGAQDPLDLADAVARATAARVSGTVLSPWKQRARELAKLSPVEATSGQQLLEGALSTLMTALLAGETPSSAGVEEALAVAGLNDGQDFALSADRMAASNVNAIIETIRSASSEDFRLAREGLDGAFRYAAARLRFEKALYPNAAPMPGLAQMEPDTPLARGLLIPPFLMHSPEDRENARARIREHEAADRLLTYFPPTLHSFLLPSNQTDPSIENQELRRDFQLHIEGFAASFPEDAEILRRAADPSGSSTELPAQ